MNRQDAFNKVWNHFVTQDNPPSMDEYGEGAYRGFEGSSCTVGLLIPDELYHSDIEGIAIHDYTNPYIGNIHAELGWTDADLPFLTHLQIAHDNHLFDEEKVGLLTELANRYGLEVPA